MYAEEPFEPEIIKRYNQDSSLFKSLNHPICIVGLPDQTNLGMSCAKYLIRELEAEKVLTYYFNDFDPSSFVTEQDQLLELTKISFYTRKNFSNQDFIIITGDGMPTSNIGVHFLAHKIAEFLSSFNPSLFLSIATFPISYSTPTPRTYLAYTSKGILDHFKIDEKIGKIEDLRLQLLQTGVVLGVTGLVVSYAYDLYDIIGGILFSEANQREKADLYATKAVLEVLNRIWNLQLSLTPLKSEISKSAEKKEPKSLSEEDFMKAARSQINF